MTRTDRNSVSATLCNASILLYMVWLLLPVVQAATHAVTGALSVAVFGVGVALDGETLPRRWRSFLPRVLAAALLPLALYLFLERGGGQFAGYYAQQGMFWFPPLWCAYARGRSDGRLYRWIGPTLVALLAVTTLTTVGWLIEGITRGDRVYAYARSLGSGEPGRADYLRELMLRNIGGYDFVYATVLLLPLTFGMSLAARGRRRAGWLLVMVFQLVLIGLSQYTYAILFAAGVMAAELLALLLRAVFRKLSVGLSLLSTVPLIAAVWLLRVPLLAWLGGLAAGFGFENATYSLAQLLLMVTGGAVDAGSRLATYTTPLAGIAASPLVGSMLGGAKALGMHSDALDLLSGMGMLGTAAFALGAWAVGRGSMKGIRRLQAFPHIALQGLLLALCLVLGTVFYSREIPLVLCLSATLLIRREAAAGDEVPSLGIPPQTLDGRASRDP